MEDMIIADVVMLDGSKERVRFYADPTAPYADLVDEAERVWEDSDRQYELGSMDHIVIRN